MLIEKPIASGDVVSLKIVNGDELIARYESEPETGEGKKELLDKARAQEAARDEARVHAPWVTFSGMLFQLAIVLLSASIIAVDMRMYYASWGVGALGILLLFQGVFLWI